MAARASYSRLSYYKKCPLAYKYKYLDKLQAKPRPPNKDKKTGKVIPHAFERGSFLHQEADDFVNWQTDKLNPELVKLGVEITEARNLKQSDPSRVVTEQKWYSNDMWMPMDHEDEIVQRDYHLITIVDLIIFSEDFTKAQVIDYKSGKRWGNEQSHSRQLNLYALAAFHRYPELEHVSAEVWYIDLGLQHKEEYTREKSMTQERYWNMSIKSMAEDEDFRPNPCSSACGFCDWGINDNKWMDKTGHCELDVSNLRTE